MSEKVIVIGAGLAGLSAALTLQEAGIDVQVHESSNRVGGRVSTDLIAGITRDHQSHLTNQSHPQNVRQ
jgi:phytoene dehydrogenase-like protein